MRHYEVGEWVDFVRNLVSETVRAEMEQHRASCKECGELLEFLESLAATAQTERAYESATVRLSASARRVFSKPAAAGARDRVVDALRTLVAHLTYDSAADLRPAGARAHRPASRQLLYEAGDFCIDLHFDQGVDSMQMTLVGQVANRKDPGFRVTRLPIVILSSTKVVAQTASNEFGEFSLDYTPRHDLRLCVSIADAGVRLEVPLKRLIEEHES